MRKLLVISLVIKYVRVQGMYGRGVGVFLGADEPLWGTLDGASSAALHGE
jgi:hypothetical protein